MLDTTKCAILPLVAVAVAVGSVVVVLPQGIRRDAPEDTEYGAWWTAAQADGFRPAVRISR